MKTPVDGGQGPIDRLRRLLPLLPGLGPDSDWLAEALGAYLDRAAEGLTVENALGLSTPTGGDAWWTVARRAERDAALRALQRQTGASVTAIAAMIVAYARRWPRDRALAELPARYRGTPSEHLFAAFHAGGGRVPTSAKQLRRIIGEGHQPPSFRVPPSARFSALETENCSENAKRRPVPRSPQAVT